MEPLYIFPGSFCPPTFGHFEIVCKAAEILPELTIVCSRNPAKGNDWFTEEECTQMWIQAYDLPDNIRVATFSDMSRESLDLSRVVLIRGIRDSRDFFGEAATINKNVKELGINKFFYIISSEKYRDISSSRVRELALQGEIQRMKHFVPSIIASDMCVRFQEDEEEEDSLPSHHVTISGCG
jgi:pantetheine-phosphate adenylyltransferase